MVKPDAASASGEPTLCISVTQPAGNITRGQSGTFGVDVWSVNWTPSSNDDVTITLSAQPAGQAAAFNSTLCGAGNHTSSCTVTAPGATPTKLPAQVPVASTASSVQSVALKAVLNPTGITLPQPPTATETAQVVAPATQSASAPASSPAASKPASASSSSSSSAATSAAAGTPASPASPGAVGTVGNIPVGPLPSLNGASTSYMGAGNASNLFPPISPSSSPSPEPGVAGRSGHERAAPEANVSLLPLGMPVVTAQVIGLVVLALAAMLALTRLSLRRRPTPAARASALNDDAAKPKDGTA